MPITAAGGYSGGPVDRKDECVTAPGLGHRLCCSWRQDNGGPHSQDEVWRRDVGIIHPSLHE